MNHKIQLKGEGRDIPLPKDYKQKSRPIENNQGKRIVIKDFFFFF